MGIVEICKGIIFILSHQTWRRCLYVYLRMCRNVCELLKSSCSACCASPIFWASCRRSRKLGISRPGEKLLHGPNYRGRLKRTMPRRLPRPISWNKKHSCFKLCSSRHRHLQRQSHFWRCWRKLLQATKSKFSVKHEIHIYVFWRRLRIRIFI